MVGLTEAELSAVVQAHAAELLPAGVRPICRPVSRGGRRAIEAMKTIDSVDLVHGLDVDLPIRRSCPRVATVHDLSVFDTPWAFSRYRAAGERAVVGRSIKTADAIIAVSAFTAERIEHHFGRSSTVIPLAPPVDVPPVDGAAVAEVRRRHRLPPRFVLQVSSIEPRKDVALLADACAELQIPLVLAGGVTGRSVPPPGAHHLGYVDQDDIPALLDAADIVAYISRYEGFGLPPLEAMARARPVVASGVGGLPEAVGDAARLFDVGDRAALVAALGQLWHDRSARDELAARGRCRMESRSWADAAEATLEVYRQLGVPA
ncbi:MAG: glycosyltransferase family 4 protein [Acidimicrobiales bacterium]